MWCFRKFSLDFKRSYLFHSNSELGDLKSLEILEGVEPIHIMLEAMGGHNTTQKFIFLALFMLSLLQNVPRAIR